jgi:hypothetical protein
MRRGQIACYRPDPAVLDRNFDEARDPFDLETVAMKGTQIPSEEGVDWGNILLCKKEKENQIESEAAVDPRRPDPAPIDANPLHTGGTTTRSEDDGASNCQTGKSRPQPKQHA